MAVLCRFRNQIEPVRRGLAERGVPVDSAETFAYGAKGIDPAVETVKVLTMHSSKGLEFSCVAVPDLGCMPHSKAPQAEEARLLYVAFTRATENLLVTYHSESQFTRQCVGLQETALAA
jgi:superfamily I DNA/RNA helicase